MYSLLLPYIPVDAANKNITWSTSNAAKATVSGGTIIPVASGTAVITVTTADGSFTASCTVTVYPADMARIPAGAFIMGSPDTEPNHQPSETQHPVTLTKSFYMGKYQVTQVQWEAVTGNTVEVQQALAGTSTTDYGRGPNHPIYWVSWYDAIVFCNKLSVMEGLYPVYSIDGSTDPDDWGPAIPTSNNAAWNAAVMDRSKNGYRLPTEAEWEYACRGDYPNKSTEINTKPFGIGDGTKVASGLASFYGKYPYDLARAGHYYDGDGTNLEKTTTTGSYTANNYGLYDMHGNLYEWCWDWYKVDITTEDNIDPVGAASGSYRDMRGGYWHDYGQCLRSAYRNCSNPYERRSVIGLRLVRS